MRAVALALLLAAPASAQVIGGEAPSVAVKFPDPNKFARGAFAEGDVGALVPLGPLGKYVQPGPALQIRAGYDLFRWLAVQAHLVGSSEAAVNLPGAFAGQALQLYVMAAEARVQLQLRRVGLYLSGGGGAVGVSTNLLDDVRITHGPRWSAALVGGVGVDVHTLNRHFSVGLAGDFVWMAQWIGAYGVTVASYLRYTR